MTAVNPIRGAGWSSTTIGDRRHAELFWEPVGEGDRVARVIVLWRTSARVRDEAPADGPTSSVSETVEVGAEGYQSISNVRGAVRSTRYDRATGEVIVHGTVVGHVRRDSTMIVMVDQIDPRGSDPVVGTVAVPEVPEKTVRIVGEPRDVGKGIVMQIHSSEKLRRYLETIPDAAAFIRD